MFGGLTLLAICLTALLWPLAGQAAENEKAVFTFGYVGLEDDPIYRRHRAYTGLTLRERQRPLDGVRTALRESRVLGRSLGTKFDLAEALVSTESDAVVAIEDLVSGEGVSVLILDLPYPLMERVGKLYSERDVIFFNARERDDQLREGGCSAVLFHTIPSYAMLTDALAQYLNKKTWRAVSVLEGPEPTDRSLTKAFEGSARKFNIRIVDKKGFVLSNDPRERDRTNIVLLTAGPSHDVIFLADTVGEFGRYVPFQTRDPVPIVGTEGLQSSAWHWTWERHGAPQLNQRFDRVAKRHMQDEEWAGWAAVKSVVEAMVRSRSQKPADIRKALVADNFRLDTYKGAPGNFRPWDNQLRQPILLHTHNAVVERAPLDGFIHEKNNLDTLGADRKDSECYLAR